MMPPVFVQHALALTLDNIRIGEETDKARIVLDLSDKSDYHSFMLSDPLRIVVDLPRLSQIPGNSERPISDTIEVSRIANHTEQTTRLVFTLKDTAILNHVFQLPASAGKPNRLVLDIEFVSESAFRSATFRNFGTLNNANNAINSRDSNQPKDIDTLVSALTQNANTPPPASYDLNAGDNGLKPFPVQMRKVVNTPQPPEGFGIDTINIPLPQRKPVVTQVQNTDPQPFQTPPKKRKKPLIVIDPGHGGQDPGAIAKNGVYEKTIVLSLSRLLRDKLVASGKYRVEMTRSTDKFIRLRNRVKFAHDRQADLFISVHADSLPKSSAYGASFYTLSETASDKQTAALAERENKADIIAGIDLNTEDEEVANILMDLVMRDTLNQSKFFANSLVKHFQRANLKTLENPHRFAGFAVLKAPDVPSVLVEAGFLSNSREAKLLTQKDHQNKLANALQSAIDNYFVTLERNQKL